MLGSRAVMNKNYVKMLDDESIKALKKIILEIYDDIMLVCKENNLICMLGGGSALGAIRHKGFIPWDDDLDVMMFRKDYNKLIDIFETKMSDKYYIFVPDRKHTASGIFMRIVKKNTILEDIYSIGASFNMGVFIDVFPIENVPKSKIHQKIKSLGCDILRYLANSNYIFMTRNDISKTIYKKSLSGKLNYYLRCILGWMISFKNYSFWFAYFDKYAQHKENTGLYTIPTGRRRYFGEMKNYDVFLPVKKVEFEKRTAYIPNKYDEYLTNLYGDYMKIPQEKDREHHWYCKFKFE